MIYKRIFIYFLFLFIPISYHFLTPKTIDSKYDKRYVFGVNDNKWLIKKDYFGDIYLDYESKIKYGEDLNKLPSIKNNLKSFDLNNFSFQLFNSIALDNQDNVVISPASISYALLMLNKGSDKSTSLNIISSLGLDNVKSDYIYSEIDSNIRKLKDKKVFINNSIWIQADDCYNPNDTYNKFIKDIFNGEIFFVDFYKDYKKLVNDINKWTFSKTKGLIDSIVSDKDIKKSTVQVLLNTLFYKNNWSIPFDSTKTKTLTFSGINGNIKTPMMHQINYYSYIKNNSYEIVKLPFKDSSISFLVALPDSSLSINDFLFNYNSEKFKNDLYKLENKRGSVYLPKFKIDFSVSLEDILIDMGMFIPFDPYLANFDGFWDYSNMCKDDPPKQYIDVVNHKTNFNIDENGIEAAAATSIIMNRITSINLDKQFNFNANRPFVYFLYDDETQSILFMGQYLGK